MKLAVRKGKIKKAHNWGEEKAKIQQFEKKGKKRGGGEVI